MGVWHLAGPLLLAGFVGACSPAPSPYAGLATGLPGAATKDTRELNGLYVNALRVRAMSIDAIQASGLRLQIIKLMDGRVGGAIDGGLYVLEAKEFTGATVFATLEDGTPAKYRIDAVDTTAVPGVDLYVLSVFDGNTWSPACGTDSTGAYAPAGVPIPAVALSEVWDPDTGSSQFDSTMFTFSCVNAAIGTCVIWGYKRWAMQTECLNLDDPSTCEQRKLIYVHQSCTRMIRADYCGLGMPLTPGGANMEVYDSYGIRSRTGSATFGLEAEWRGDGAHCIHFTRFTKADPQQSPMDATDLDFITRSCRGRLAVEDPSCADPAASHFFTQNGFSDLPAVRLLLRSETYQR